MASPTHDLNELKRRMQGAIALLKQELGGLRTGRASATLLEPVQVEAYGTHMPLNQLATVSVPEPRLLSVQVWDKSMVQAVEKAIPGRQSRPHAVDRRAGAAAAHSRAQRGAAQGTGQGRAQICRSRQGRGAPCPARRPRCAQEAGERTTRSAKTRASGRPSRCRRQPTKPSSRSTGCLPRRKRKSSRCEACRNVETAGAARRPDPNSSVPRHVAIIMDGNGRWAPRAACRAPRAIAAASRRCGVRCAPRATSASAS